MRHISLSTPTADYSAWVAQHPQATWDELRDAQQGSLYNSTRDALAAHQQCLCAFCEINLIESDREIDHWHPKSDASGTVNWAIAFQNLQVSCRGGTSHLHPIVEMRSSERFLQPIRKNLSCGAKKGETFPEGLLFRANEIPSAPPIFLVDFEGQMHVDAHACAVAGIDRDQAAKTIEILGLDCRRLQRARAAWWEIISNDMLELIGTHPPAEIARRYLTSDMAGRLPKFFSTLRSMFGSVAEQILNENA